MVPGIRARQRQQVLHHPAHPLALTRNIVQGGDAIIGGDVIAFQQQADVPTNGG